VTRNLLRRSAALLATAALVAGCSYKGASSLPLPGAIGGSGTYPITVVLDDATNLVPEETCRANDTVIGSVQSVTLTKDLKAKVVCRIKDSVHLPANAVATLSETSLLGERFVALDPPAGTAPVGVLAPGTTMPVSSTRADPDVEVVFGALSQVLNGGSLGSIQTITRELNAALTGSDLRGTIDQLHGIVATFNDHRDEIAASLVALDRLAGNLAHQRTVIADALDSIPGGLAVLSRQRARLVDTLQRLSSLSATAVPLIRASRANTVADLRHLAPVLTQVSKAGSDLALTLGRFATFPFPSTALSTIKGDFAGMYATFDLDVDLLNRLLAKPGTSLATVPKPLATTPAPATLPLPLLSGLSTLTTGLQQLLTGLIGGAK
jgi:phospholipid/cholesterol/gamma-HCH transport system substrate-binding protein